MKLRTLFLSLLIVLIIMLLIYSCVYRDQSVFLFSSLIVSIMFFARGKFNITNPDIWLVAAINVYHLSIFVLDFIGFRLVENKFQLVSVNFIALLGYFFASILLINPVAKSRELLDTISLPKNYISGMLVLSFLSTLIVPISYILSGATTKSEFNNSFGSLFSIFNFVYIIYILKTKRESFNYSSIYFFTIYLLFCTMLLGERNIFLSFVLIVIMLAYRRFNMSKTKLISMCIVLLLLIPTLGVYKNMFTRNDLGSVESNSILISLMNGEFRSAGYNVNYIIGEEFEYKYGASLITDLARSLVPSNIYYFENSIAWYNNKFHPDVVAQGRGYGFSLAAEGYINFGYVGVFVWFFLASVIIIYIYNKSYENSFYLCVYLMMVPICIYAMRGDFSTIFSPLFKQVLAPYFMMYFVYYLLRRI